MTRPAWVLLPHQEAAFRATEPFKALVTGVGGGKTHFGSRWIWHRALRFRNSAHLATGNTYRQCLDVVVPALLAAAEEWGLTVRWAKSDFEIRGQNLGLIRIRSLDKPDTVARGAEYGSWWGDEVRDTTKEAADLAMARLRCAKVDRPEYLWTTTPNGYDHIYDRHVKLREEQLSSRGASDYALIRGSGRANRFLIDGYHDRLADSYDVKFAAQEIDGEFVTLGIGQAYYAFSRALNVAEVEHLPNSVAYLGIDFGADPSCVAVLQRRPDGVWIVLDEVFGRSRTVADCLRDLAEAGWTAHRGYWSLEPDPAGKARNQAGFTDHALAKMAARDLGFVGAELMALRSAPSIRDKVNTVNALLCNSRGERRLLIHPRCVHLIEDLERVVWKTDGTLDKGPHGLFTHSTDSIAYCLYRNARPAVHERQRYLGKGRYAVDAG